ncbi:hypothetical protein M3667_00625 [Microbacterium sp. P26]|uniref:hypothetical protein n=1 Tax=Microbacterium TaxID=33882 RepID=UPI00203C9CAC|nr:hypothetical protein [Microbacterium sp. P26]MCM3500378.1 hypothetical protein [Microbacterium sp. P26]
MPAVALATSTPAFAQTGSPAPALTFSQAPASTPACSPTTSPFVAQLSGPDNVGKLVQFSLPSGWSWTSGTGSYVTDANGFARVPAGAITANTSSGTVAATSSSLTASTSVDVASYGTLQTDKSAAAFPSGSNTDIVRMYASAAGLTVSKKNGDIWSWYNGGPWTQVGTGADTDVQRMTFIDASATHEALWIKDGVLQMGTSVAAIPQSSNADFVRVDASGAMALAVRSNGDLWRWDEPTGWAKTASGVATGFDQMACFSGQTKTACYWIAGGVLYVDGVADTIGSGDNNGVSRVYAAQGYSDEGANLAIVKTNGDAWTYSTGNGWRPRDTGASTGLEQAAARVVGRGMGAVWTLKSGVLWGTPNSRTGTNQLDWASYTPNENLLRIVAPGQLALVVTGAGELFTFDAWYWTQKASGVATGAGQAAAALTDGWNSPYFWLVPSSC